MDSSFENMLEAMADKLTLVDMDGNNRNIMEVISVDKDSVTINVPGLPPLTLPDNLLDNMIQYPELVSLVFPGLSGYVLQYVDRTMICAGIVRKLKRKLYADMGF